MEPFLFPDRNEDLGDYSARHYIVVPPEQHAPGETVTTWYGAEVPQVEHTLGYIATTIFHTEGRIIWTEYTQFALWSAGGLY